MYLVNSDHKMCRLLSRQSVNHLAFLGNETRRKGVSFTVQNVVRHDNC